MAASAYLRGHRVVWAHGVWRWADTYQPASDERPCPLCGLTAAPGGPDPCLGWLPGVTAACCGHGVTESYVKRAEEGWTP